MNVLVLNASPHANGCTARALQEIVDTLHQEGVETQLLHIGRDAVHGCISCGYCDKNDRCVFDGDKVNEAAKLFEAADGLIIGSPVYYGSPNGAALAFMDRLFYSTGFDKTMKVGASVAVARRGGCSATFDELNKFFTLSDMPVATSNYWNNIYGWEPGEGKADAEGRQVMRMLARNMVFLMRSIVLGKNEFGAPTLGEQRVWTNFTR